jgi:hypothetical protein
MICIFCGSPIEKQIPIVVSLEFKPPISQEIAGLDTLTHKYCHQACYAAIMKNAGKASEAASKEYIEANK